MTTPTRSQLLADLATDLRRLERPLRILALNASRVHGVTNTTIFNTVFEGQDEGTPDIAVVHRVLTEPLGRKLTTAELEGLFYFLWRHHSDPQTNSEAYLWPLLNECFSARQLPNFSLAIPRRADAILSITDQVEEFCNAYKGTHQCFRYGTSRHTGTFGEMGPEDHLMIRFAVRIFPFRDGLGKYQLIYQGSSYVRRIEGAISVTADRAYFIGREDTRDHLSWMVWRPILKVDPRLEPGKGIVQAANPAQTLFAALLVYRRWPGGEPTDEDCERWCGPTDATDEFERQIKQEGWLDKKAKDLNIIELDDLD